MSQGTAFYVLFAILLGFVASMSFRLYTFELQLTQPCFIAQYRSSVTETRTATETDFSTSTSQGDVASDILHEGEEIPLTETETENDCSTWVSVSSSDA
jgi:hypothetical protein